MQREFNDLNALVQQEFPPEADLTDKVSQFQDASLEEVFDFLEEAMESYQAFSSALPAELKKSARAEVRFFAGLFRQRLAKLIKD